MNTETKVAEDAQYQAFVDGALREELGLTSDDLKLALTVAKNHMHKGAHVQALKLYATLILCEPKSIDAQIGLANAALHLDLAELALQSASVAISLAPHDARGYYLSGRACLGLGLVDEGLLDLNEAVEIGIKSKAATVVNSARQLLQTLSQSGSSPDRRVALR